MTAPGQPLTDAEQRDVLAFCMALRNLGVAAREYAAQPRDPRRKAAVRIAVKSLDHALAPSPAPLPRQRRTTP
jgi:hypothetical protein